MSKMFQELIRRSKRINRDEFASNFGGIAEDVVDMLNSPLATKATLEAREAMENSKPLSNGTPRLRQMEFGLFSTAPELEKGDVAGIDGTPALPMQVYSAGQALCVGVGSVSYRRPFLDSMHYWSSKIFLEDSKSTDDFLSREEQGLFGISQTAYLRYFEVKHALDIEEPVIFLDGTLVYEWLVATQEGVKLYLDLFKSGKKCIGVIKSLKANVLFATYSRAIKTGEVYIIQTLADHLNNSFASNKNPGESAVRYTLPEFRDGIAPRILRGIFKPRKKTFGFEVHEDHLEDMLRIMSADCQMNNPGHEIPYLLNRVDEDVKKNFNQRILQDRIAVEMTTQNEELFFEETHERAFR